jgi:hypothetical protein
LLALQKVSSVTSAAQLHAFAPGSIVAKRFHLHDFLIQYDL